MFTNIQIVRVHEVIMSGSSHMIGSIRYTSIDDETPLKDNTTLKTNNLPLARPLIRNISQYPAVNEIVHVLGGPKDTYNETGAPMSYYLPPVNIFGSVNHNALADQLTEEELEAQVETGLDYFKEIENVRPLQPYLGDITLEGRYGQSIRFGSTISGSHIPNNWSNEGEPGNPITIIRNGQTNDPLKANFNHILEDINGDDSSVYLCSNQQITNFQKAGVYPKDHPASYKHML
tara:strand:- start:1883 stop:2581 length:699 start_codon:yes stop_codon:yes gene_type:complete